MILLSPLKRSLERSKLKQLLIVLPLLGLSIFALTLALQKNSKPQYYDSCGTILHHGQWVRNSTKVHPSYWQPQDCTMHQYDLSDIKQCMRPGSRIIFFGDSTVRKIFWSTAPLLDSGILEDKGLHSNIKFERHNITINMLWDPYLNLTESADVLRNISQNATRQGEITYLYISTGLWHAMFERRERVMEGFKASVDNTVDMLKNALPGAFGGVYWAPTQVPQYHLLDQSRNKKITPEYIDQMLNYTNTVFGYDPTKHSSENNQGILYADNGRPLAYYTPVFNKYGNGHPTVFDQIGLHYQDVVADRQAQSLLNHYCNGRIMKPEVVPHTTTCCMSYNQPTSTHQFMIMLVLVLAMILMFLMFMPPEQWSSLTLQATLSIVILTVLTALYTYICDRTHQLNKQYNVLSWYELFAMSQLLLVGIVLTIARKSASSAFSLLGGEETLLSEWKGLAIALWIIAKVTGLWKEYYAGEVFTKIMESSLVFVETFDFAVSIMSGQLVLVHFVNKLLRVSILPITLAWSLDTSYYFYGIAAKLSFWYVFVFAGYGILNGAGFSAIISKVLNRDINSSQPNVILDALKLMVLTLVFGFGVLVMWTPFSESVLPYPVDLKDEFWVGVTAVALGAIVTNGPLIEALSVQLQGFKFTLALFAGLLFIALTNWAFLSGSFVSPEQYPRTYHQIITLGYVLVYIIARFAFVGQESYLYSNLLDILGRCWFEMFVLSYHAYLAGDGTLRLYILTTGTTGDTPNQLNWRRVSNFVILTTLFVFLAQKIAAAWDSFASVLTSETMLSKKSSNDGTLRTLSPFTLELYSVEDQHNGKLDKLMESTVTVTTPTSCSSLGSVSSDSTTGSKE